MWRGDKPDAQRGVVVLCSPVGHPAFVQSWAEERLRTEQLLLDELPKRPDLQCAWLLLLLCASTGANHAIRTMPPSAFAAYARGHDDAIWATLQTMLGGVGDRETVQARLLAAPPVTLGGLGLQSAQLTAPAAYRAAWADALPALHVRLPRAAAGYVQLLEAEPGEATHCLAEAGLEQLPHVARDPRRQPPRPCSEPRRRRLAARLAVPCFADPHRTLSRTCGHAVLPAQFPCAASLSGGAACRSMAHSYTLRKHHHPPTASDASRFEATPALGAAALCESLWP